MHHELKFFGIILAAMVLTNGVWQYVTTGGLHVYTIVAVVIGVVIAGVIFSFQSRSKILYWLGYILALLTIPIIFVGLAIVILSSFLEDLATWVLVGCYVMGMVLTYFFLRKRYPDGQNFERHT